MAQIVFGAGTSHTPYLLAADETLVKFQETDSVNKHRDKEGRPVTYGELLEKADPKLANMVAPEHLVARQNVARGAVKKLRQTVSNAKLDALIVLGDDQNESYKDDCHPAFAIYFGDTILKRQQAAQYLFPLAGVVHQEPRRVLRAGKTAAVSGSLKARAAHDRNPDGRQFRHHGLEVPAGRGRRGSCHRLCASPCDGLGQSGAGRAGLPQTPIIRRTSRVRRAAMRSGRRSARRWKKFPVTSASVSRRLRTESLLRRRGVRPRHPEGARQQGCGIPQEPAAQQAQFRLVGNSQLGRHRRCTRTPRHDVVRICAGLPHSGRDRHGHELCKRGRRFFAVIPGRCAAATPESSEPTFMIYLHSGSPPTRGPE